MSRPLHELELRAGILKSVSEALREQCLAIARDTSPSASINLAHLAATQQGGLGMDAFAVAKATRWLAVIRRVHGNEVFTEAVARLTMSTATGATDTKGE
jgi:hypothetical protein